MVSKFITMGAEHERHMILSERVLESVVVFSSMSMPTAVTNRVMTAVAFPPAQYEFSMN